MYSPDTYVDTNIKGTLNVLQAARDLEAQRVIHTSTSEVYGTARFVPITENTPARAVSYHFKIGAINSHSPFMLLFKRQSV